MKGASNLVLGTIVLIIMAVIVLVLVLPTVMKSFTSTSKQAQEISELTPYVLKAIGTVPCALDCFTVMTPDELKPLVSSYLKFFSCTGASTCSSHKTKADCEVNACIWTIESQFALKEFQNSNISLEYFPCNYEVIRWATLASLSANESLSKARLKMYSCLRADDSKDDNLRCSSEPFKYYCDKQEYLKTLPYFPCMASSLSVPDYPIEYIDSSLGYIYFGDIKYKQREMDSDIVNGYICNSSWYSGVPFNICMFEDLKYNESVCRPAWKTIRTKEGDCRDFATSAWTLLRAVNFPSNSMELSFGYCDLPCPCKVLFSRTGEERCTSGFLNSLNVKRTSCNPDAWLKFKNIPPEITDLFAKNSVAIEDIKPCSNFIGIDFGSLHKITTPKNVFYIESPGNLFSQKMNSPNYVTGYCYNPDGGSSFCSLSKTSLCFDDATLSQLPTEELTNMCLSYFYGAEGGKSEIQIKAYLKLNCPDCDSFCGEYSGEPVPVEDRVPADLNMYCGKKCPLRYDCANTESGVDYDDYCYNGLCDGLKSLSSCSDLITNSLMNTMCEYIDKGFTGCFVTLNSQTCDLSNICSCKSYAKDLQNLQVSKCSDIAGTTEFNSYISNGCNIPGITIGDCSLDNIMTCYDKCNGIVTFSKLLDEKFRYYCDNCINLYPQCSVLSSNVADKCAEDECASLKLSYDLRKQTCTDLYPELNLGLKAFTDKYAFPLYEYPECNIAVTNSPSTLNVCPINFMKTCDYACHGEQGIASYKGYTDCNDLINPNNLYDSDVLGMDPFLYWNSNCGVYTYCLIGNCDISLTKTCSDKCSEIKTYIQNYVNNNNGNEPTGLEDNSLIKEFSSSCSDKTCKFDISISMTINGQTFSFTKPYDITKIAACVNKCVDLNSGNLFSYCDECSSYSCTYENVKDTLATCTCYNSCKMQQQGLKTASSCSDLMQRKYPGVEMFCDVKSGENFCYNPDFFGCSVDLTSGTACGNPWVNNNICGLKDACFDVNTTLTRIYNDCSYDSFAQESSLQTFCNSYWNKYSCDITPACLNACNSVKTGFYLLTQQEKDALTCTSLTNCGLDVTAFTGLGCSWVSSCTGTINCALIKEEIKCTDLGCSWNSDTKICSVSGSPPSCSGFAANKCKSLSELTCPETLCKLSWTTSLGEQREAVLASGTIERCNLDTPCCTYLRSSVNPLTCGNNYAETAKQTLLNICNNCDLTKQANVGTCTFSDFCKCYKLCNNIKTEISSLTSEEKTALTCDSESIWTLESVKTYENAVCTGFTCTVTWDSQTCDISTIQ